MKDEPGGSWAWNWKSRIAIFGDWIFRERVSSFAALTHLNRSKTKKSRKICQKSFGDCTFLVVGFRDYFGTTSRANLLATTSRRSARFLPASIIASREP